MKSSERYLYRRQKKWKKQHKQHPWLYSVGAEYHLQNVCSISSKLKNLFEDNFEDIARIITLECGKIIEEARGEVRRAIENVEIACGIPILMQGYLSEDIAPGIDELMIRQPVGVAATIAPFNFPGMIPFWYMPYAIACGNTYIVKPSERVPLTMQKIFQLVEQTGLPKGRIEPS